MVSYRSFSSIRCRVVPLASSLLPKFFRDDEMMTNSETATFDYQRSEGQGTSRGRLLSLFVLRNPTQKEIHGRQIPGHLGEQVCGSVGKSDTTAYLA